MLSVVAVSQSMYPKQTIRITEKPTWIAQKPVRITQKLILQPRAELDFSLQDIPELGIGAGLSQAALGLRLRYQISPLFAPYAGVEYERAFGDTRRFQRAEGEVPSSWNFVVGLRTWF